MAKHKDDLILISVDDHIAEPADMFEGHVPEKYRELAPRVLDEPDGAQQWYYGDIRGRNLGLNAVAGKPPELFNVNPNRYEDMRPGCYDVHERVRDMSAGGQLAGLNFPNWTGFSGQVLNQGPDRDVNLVMIKAYNDWHVDEWCGAYPERFIPCGILPLFDVEEAAKEVRRLADKGCHAVTFSENPAGLGMPSIHTREWDPLFAACSDSATVLCCHIGSSSKASSTSPDAPPPVPMNLSSGMAIYTLGDLLWADFWHRFPNLRFSLTEGDIGWIPYFLWRAEHTLERHNGWMNHQQPQGLSPTELFHERILVCFINDRVGVKLLDEFSLEQVCWESDYPHSDSSWPDTPEKLWALVSDLDENVVDHITHLNAMKHYQFDPFATRAPGQCTAAALRAEATDVDTVTHVGRLADETDRAAWRQMTGAAASAGVSKSRGHPVGVVPCARRWRMNLGRVSSAALMLSGLAGVVIPSKVAASLDLTASSGRGIAEAPAGLGGTYAALGAWALLSRRPTAQAAVGVVWLGAASARLAALVIDDPEPDASYWSYLIAELGFGSLAIISAGRRAA